MNIRYQRTRFLSIGQADYGELGILFITVLLISLTLPLIVIAAVKASPLKHV